MSFSGLGLLDLSWFIVKIKKRIDLFVFWYFGEYFFGESRSFNRSLRSLRDLSRNMGLIVNFQFFWHSQIFWTEIHCGISDWDWSETSQSSSERGDRDANLFDSLFSPGRIKHFGILTCSLLNFKLGMAFKRSDHVEHSLLEGKFIVEFKEGS